MRSTRAAGRYAAAYGLLGLALAGCGLTHMQDLNFRVDDRLHFRSPADRSVVRPPVTITWTMRDFALAAPGSAPPSRNAGYFAVFLDRSPVKPGATLRDVAGSDPTCLRNPHCPGPGYLRDHGVFVTTVPSLQLRLLPPILGGGSGLQLHTITVVLMDTAGHRIGESAWELDLRTPKVGV